MTEQSIPTAKINPKKGLSFIWLLPFVTLLIGVGLIYELWQNRGIDVFIQFQTAEGLEVNKTKVRYRNVDVGVLKAVHFTEDNQAIIAEVEVNKPLEHLLKQDSQFWIVKPRIGSKGVSGIGTIFSGAYIHLEPGKSALGATEYTGLESPPITSPTTDGLRLRLTTTHSGGVQVGNPVMYRGYKVGVVEASEFDPTSRLVKYDVFIHAPYQRLVTTNTVFWNASGASVSTSAAGVTLDLPSIESLVSGGVQFDVLEEELGQAAKPGSQFVLYQSKQQVADQQKFAYLEFLVLVEDNIGGLEKGAPVEYRGIRIGSVAEPYLGFEKTTAIDVNESRIPVLIHIEPERLYHNSNFDIGEFKQRFIGWVKGGMTAKIEALNLLTGSLKMSLVLSDNEIDQIEYFGDYAVIPSGKSSLESFTAKIDTILDTITSLPLKQTVEQVNNSLKAAETSLGQIDKTLVEVQKGIKGLQPDSDLYGSIDDSLSEIKYTLEQVQPLVNKLNNRPNSLIFAGAPEADEEPQGK